MAVSDWTCHAPNKGGPLDRCGRSNAYNETVCGCGATRPPSNAVVAYSNRESSGVGVVLDRAGWVTIEYADGQTISLNPPLNDIRVASEPELRAFAEERASVRANAT